VLNVIRTLDSFQKTPGELSEVFAAAFKLFHRNDDDEAFTLCFDTSRQMEVPFQSSAFATVLRMRMRHAQSTEEISRVEEELRALGYVPDMTGNSVIIAACARMLHFGDKGSEEVMLSKVDTLLGSIEGRMKQGDPDMDISSAHLRAVLRGYGAAGRPELMKTAWKRLQYKGLSNDTRVYNEMLKWFALMGNVKEALNIKYQMAEENVSADAQTYTWIFRALGKWYPRQVDKFYDELRMLRIRPDVTLYTTLLGMFGDLQLWSRVDDIVAEMQQREEQGTLQASPSTYAVLMRIFSKKSLARVEQVFRDAQAKGFGTHEHIVTSLLHAYALHGGDSDGGDARLEKVLKSLPAWTTNVYNVLLSMHGKANNKEKVDELVEKMKRDKVEFNDITYGTLITVYGRLKNTDKVAETIEMLKKQEGQVSANFYSILAATYSKLGDTEGIDDAWEDLMSSKLFPDTETYNSFLALYSKTNNVARMQTVMDSLMRQVKNGISRIFQSVFFKNTGAAESGDGDDRGGHAGQGRSHRGHGATRARYAALGKENCSDDD